MIDRLRRPALVAAWPGLGGVAQIAGTYLVEKLHAEPVAHVDAPPALDVPSVTVKGGLLQPVSVPRCTFHAWRNPDGDRDLLIALSDQQPSQRSWAYAELLLDEAERHGVGRVFTFAALGAPVHPTAVPRVVGMCTRTELLTDLHHAGIDTLLSGEITGLNGVFLAAAAARRLPGIGLLGEFPFFAAGVPNPKTSAAVLRAFGRLADVRLDLSELDDQARDIEAGLLKFLANLERDASRSARSREAAPDETPSKDPGAEDTADGSTPPDGETPMPKEPELSEDTRHRIEQLFEEVKRNRSKALELKAELDRAGAFKQFEDRFLDLFRQAG
ncbi:MAG TPA: PAC2 family protein [Planctomycetota bacterium]|nr:PAC2 family protein [Planctomycetota bacterium]